MKLKCYIMGCKNESPDISLVDVVWGVIYTRSLHPYVCADHRDVFAIPDEVMEDTTHEEDFERHQLGGATKKKPIPFEEL